MTRRRRDLPFLPLCLLLHNGRSRFSGQIPLLARLRTRVAELERERQIPLENIEKSPVMISIVLAPDFIYELVNPAFRALAPGRFGRFCTTVAFFAASGGGGALAPAYAAHTTAYIFSY